MIGAQRARGVPGSVPRTTLPQHGLTRYLRVRLEVTDGALRWEVPRTLLGVVPIGVRHIAVPLDNIRSARMTKAVSPVRLAVGLAAIVLPLIFGLWWLAVPLGILGAWVLLVSFGPHLELVAGTGKRYRAAVCFGHTFDAELYLDALNDLIEKARQSRQHAPAG